MAGVVVGAAVLHPSGIAGRPCSRWYISEVPEVSVGVTVTVAVAAAVVVEGAVEVVAPS